MAGARDRSAERAPVYMTSGSDCVPKSPQSAADRLQTGECAMPGPAGSALARLRLREILKLWALALVGISRGIQLLGKEVRPTNVVRALPLW